MSLRRLFLLSVAVALPLMAGRSAHAQDCRGLPAPAAYESRDVREHGLVGGHLHPTDARRRPALVISGRADTMRPSTRMARLDANHFRFPHTHVAFDNAGHAAGSPPQAQTNPQFPDRMVGGT